jgi:predicted nucleic acid-binding protein
MAYKIFLDRNILIDFLDNQRANHVAAAELIDQAEAGNCFSYVTESVLNTTAYLLRKAYPAKKIKSLLHDLLSFTELIPVNKVMYITGLNSAVNDLEDSILYTAAIHARLDYYITNDSTHFQQLEVATLPVLTARKFLDLQKA